MNKLDELFKVLTIRLGRKGAILCVGFAGLMFAYLVVVGFQAWRNQSIEGAWNTFCAAEAGLILAFIGGNAAEHFAKRGQQPPQEGSAQ